MVDIVALNAVSAGLGNPVAALPQPSAEAVQALTEITSGGLSEVEISTLSAAVAQVDAGVQSTATRESLLHQVQGLGMFFRNTDTNGFPRWPLMTALRAYGLNLSGQSTNSEAAVAAQVQQQLNSIAQQSRGTTLNQALAAATAAVVVGPTNTAPKPVTKTETHVAVTPAAPAPTVTAVDKLV